MNYLKNGGYPQYSFWISKTLVKIYRSCIITNRGKNTFELEVNPVNPRHTRSVTRYDSPSLCARAVKFDAQTINLVCNMMKINFAFLPSFPFLQMSIAAQYPTTAITT